MVDLMKSCIQCCPLSQSLHKNPALKKKKRINSPQIKKPCYDADGRDNTRSNTNAGGDGDDDDGDEEDAVPRETPQPPESDSESDSDLEDVDAVMERLPDNPGPLLEFSSASQGVLLLLVLKQHLKTLYGFSDRWGNTAHPVRATHCSILFYI